MSPRKRKLKTTHAVTGPHKNRLESAIPSVGKARSKWLPGVCHGTSTFPSCWVASAKAEHRPKPCDRRFHPGLYPSGDPYLLHPEDCTKMLLTTLVKTARTSTQPKRLPPENGALNCGLSTQWNTREQGSASFSYQGLDSKYFRLCRQSADFLYNPLQTSAPF